MNSIDPSQSAAAFDEAMRQAAPLRSQAIQHYERDHRAQESALKVEASRVLSRYGSDSTEAKEAQARMDAHAARGRMIASELRRAQVPVPQPAPDAFIVYGLVLDSAGVARKGIEITATGNACASAASTRSGGDGAFLLCIPAAKAATPAKDTAADRTAEVVKTESTADAAKMADRTEKAKAKKTEKASTATPVSSFQLVLTDATKTMTFRYPEVFEVKAGALAYREIATPAPTAE